MFGGSGNDSLYGRDQSSVSSGDIDDNPKDAHDTLYGGSGDDIAYGGTGNDLLFAGTGLDSLDGGTGNDTLNEGGITNRIIYPAPNLNFAIGTDAAPNPVDANGNPIFPFQLITLTDDEGQPILDANGDPVLVPVAVPVPAPVLVKLDGTQIAPFSVAGLPNYDPEKVAENTNDNLADTLYGGAGNDFISAGDDKDYLDGGIDSDTLVAFQGATTIGNNLDGGAGDDALIGGVAADTLKGGVGNDNLVGNGGNDSLDGGAGVDALFGDAGDDILDGGAGDDGGLGFGLFGGDGNDSLIGGADDGDDDLFGEDGRDTLYGGDGNDLLDDGGDTVADSLIGGNGNDVLIGSASSDTLYGGLGADTYILRGQSPAAQDFNSVVFDNGAALDVASGIGNVDTLIDYVLGDQLVLDKTTFTTLEVGSGVSYNAAPTADNIGFIGGTDVGADTVLTYFTSNTDTTGVDFAVIQGQNLAGTLDNSDFKVIA
jgi:Ca2+-binding RTX toxin-like protein